MKYICNSDLIPSERIVIMYLASNSSDNSIQIRVEDLAETLNLGEATIKRSLSALISKGYLVKRRLGQGNPNIYTIIK